MTHRTHMGGCVCPRSLLPSGGKWPQHANWPDCVSDRLCAAKGGFAPVFSFRLTLTTAAWISALVFPFPVGGVSPDGKGTASVYGVVTAKPGDVPLPGAIVRLIPVDPQQFNMAAASKHFPEAVTDTSGTYELHGLRPGPYDAVAFTPKTKMHILSPRAFVRRNLADGETTRVDWVLYPGHNVFGRVTDRATGLPLSGVKVTGDSGSDVSTPKITGPDGRYMVRGIVDWEIEAKKAGFLLVDENGRPKVRVELPRTTFDVGKDLTMARLVAVSGVVHDGGGRPVAGAEVFVATTQTLFMGRLWQPHVVVSNSRGRFSVPAPSGSVVWIMADARGYARNHSCAVAVGATSVDGVEIVLLRPVTLGGTVLKGWGGPFNNTFVTANEKGATSPALFGGWQTHTDGHGRFTLRGIPPNRTITIRASAWNRVDSGEQEVTLGPGGKKTDLIFTVY